MARISSKPSILSSKVRLSRLDHTRPSWIRVADRKKRKENSPLLRTYDGTLKRIHHALYEQCREQAERAASPSAAIIDSQSVKSAEKGGPISTRMATMRARRSRARSGTFWSTH